jgi:hypothetical protein|tara:strand:- start:165 stop:533 length:369 start_codon:yes stop_codon:yes gene_type:complete
MGLNLKMFDTLGMVTLVTPPSMLNPEKISFTLIHLKEKEKNHFATQLNKVFPNDNCTVFIYDTVGNNGWLKQAISKSKYVIMEKDKAPLWIEELIPESKTYYISAEQTVEQTFQKINEERKD